MYFIHSITSYYADSSHFGVYRLLIVMCHQSDRVVDRTQDAALEHILN